MKEFIGIIVLAAGEASRFGSAKQLAELHGQALLSVSLEKAEQLKSLLRSRVKIESRSILVVGAHYEQIRSHRDLSFWNEVVVNSDWQTGMSSSIAAGFNNCLQQEQGEEAVLKGALLLLVDQPLLDVAELLDQIQVGLEESVIVCADYLDSVGPPVFVPKEEMLAFLEIEEQGADRGGAKSFIKQREHCVVTIAGALDDVDTPADLNRISQQIRVTSESGH